MRIAEIQKSSPTSSAVRQRLDSLKASAKRADKAAKIEQERQRMAKAQQSLTKLRQPSVNR